VPIGPRHPRCVALVAALVLTACSTSAATPSPTAPSEVDPGSGSSSAPPASSSDDPSSASSAVDGPHEVALVADFGPLPDGSGRAVVEATWTTDGDGTVHFVLDTPAGITDQHVLTADEHWWWLHPEARRTIADVEWIHFELDVIAEVGGALPDVVVDARQPPPQPHGIAPGDVVAGHEVQAVDAIGEDEVHLTVAVIERPVVLRRRALPPGTSIDVPVGAVDVRELPDHLRW
jgi:hypothetical protein